MNDAPGSGATEDVRNVISVVIVEDEALFRHLLRDALARRPNLAVLGAFGDAETAARRIPELAPRVALLDIELGGGRNGIQLGLQLRATMPDLGIVLLSNHEDPQFVAALPREVLSGWSYLLKRSVGDIDALVHAIRGAASGFVVLDPRLVSGMRQPQQGPLQRLTPRQRDVLLLIAQGLTNGEIAHRLEIAEKSVENQINLLYQALDIDRSDPTIHPRVRAVLIYLHESTRGV